MPAHLQVGKRIPSPASYPSLNDLTLQARGAARIIHWAIHSPDGVSRTYAHI